MSQGRIGASHTAVLGIALLCLLVQFEIVYSATYLVGGKQGWDLYPELIDWPNGKHFKAGDVLVFNYKKEAKYSLFSVAAVDEDGYQHCNVGDNAKNYTSGYDHVTLVKGPNYFICVDMDYCSYGMRIAVHAG